MISLGFCFSHAKPLLYIFDINKSIFQQILKMFAAYFDQDKICCYVDNY